MQESERVSDKEWSYEKRSVRLTKCEVRLPRYKW